MKIFKDITDAPVNLLIHIMQKLFIGLFCMGMSIGITVMLTGISAKNNDHEDTLILSGISIFLLLVSILLYTFVRKKLIPEIEKRLKLNGVNVSLQNTE